MSLPTMPGSAAVARAVGSGLVVGNSTALPSGVIWLMAAFAVEGRAALHPELLQWRLH